MESGWNETIQIKSCRKKKEEEKGVEVEAGMLYQKQKPTKVSRAGNIFLEPLGWHKFFNKQLERWKDMGGGGR